MVDILKNFPLFQEIAVEDMSKLLLCLSAQEKSYVKGSWILDVETSNGRVGLVLQGQLQMVHHDYYGNRTIFSDIQEGQLFGETLAGISDINFPLLVEAKTDCSILFLIIVVSSALVATIAVLHRTLIYNMLQIINEKNRLLSEKLLILSKRSSREKLLAFLSSEAQRFGSNEFSISYNRQELADYLSLDRSALSNELSKLQKEGFLQYHRNQFVLLKGAESA